jgi:hypothetical protein
VERFGRWKQQNFEFDHGNPRYFLFWRGRMAIFDISHVCTGTMPGF